MIYRAIKLADAQGWRPPVISTQAHRKLGILELHDAIQEHHRNMEESAELERRRRERQRQEFTLALKERVEAGIANLMDSDGALGEIGARVESGELDPYSAAEQAIGDGLLFSELAKTLAEEG